MAYVMPADSPQHRASGQDGFVLIEVLVSALVITIVAGAVLAVVTATTHSAADQRIRSNAYGLAQEDQARLRTMRISSLNHLVQTRAVTLGGSQFTVESTGVFVNGKSGTPSCVSGEATADYVRITSTVRWPNIGTHKPVVFQSIVSPSNGSLDPSHGTLVFNATNALGTPLSGVSISANGVGTFSGSTDSSGCANFADQPSGNYTVTTSAAGMINMLGESVTSKTIGVLPSGTQTVSLRYDRGGKLRMRFEYRVGSSAEFKAANADSIVVYNAESGASGQTFWTPAKTRQATVEATPLFPFKNFDTVYAGACETNNPVPKEEEVNPPGAPARAKVLIPAAGEAEAVIKLPALELTVSKGATPVSGAKVTITDDNCSVSGTPVKREYTTNASGHQINPTTLLPEPGLPWSKYDVCASANVSGTNRRLFATNLTVQNLTSATTKTLDLNGAGSESNKTCP
jgi:Tfp pilus assembly protein PilV